MALKSDRGICRQTKLRPRRWDEKRKSVTHTKTETTHQESLSANDDLLYIFSSPTRIRSYSSKFGFTMSTMNFRRFDELRY